MQTLSVVGMQPSQRPHAAARGDARPILVARSFNRTRSMVRTMSAMAFCFGPTCIDSSIKATSLSHRSTGSRSVRGSRRTIETAARTIRSTGPQSRFPPRRPTRRASTFCDGTTNASIAPRSQLRVAGTRRAPGINGRVQSRDRGARRQRPSDRGQVSFVSRPVAAPRHRPSLATRRSERSFSGRLRANLSSKCRAK